MIDGGYSALAAVYEWLLADEVVTPEGYAQAMVDAVPELPLSGRVLDCAAGTGLVAIGLAERGYEVVATDASVEMLNRARRLAHDRGVHLETAVCTWEELPDRHFAPFDVIWCVGNSLAHAAGEAGRRAALSAMRALLAPAGILVVTSRNWEKVRSRGRRLDVRPRVVTRDGRPGVVIYSWGEAAPWGDQTQLDITVALIGGDATITSRGERVTFWPFTHEMLDRDLVSCGLEALRSTYDVDSDSYLVVAQPFAQDAAQGDPPTREPLSQ